MGGMKLPLDAYLLAVPLTCGLLGFFGMTARVPLRDPEASRSASFYDDELNATKVAQKYENDIKGVFEARIRARKFGIFNNDVGESKM